MNIKKRVTPLERQLRHLVTARLTSFDKIKEIEETGVYAIYENGKGHMPIYIGKSERPIRERMGEMISDYRSHTLNKKILFETLKKRYKWDVDNMRKKDVEAKFKKLKDRTVLQHIVNNRIRNGCKIRFIGISDVKRIEQFEHFAIGVVNPEFND